MGIKEKIINSIIGIEGETVLLHMLNSLQDAKYVSLAERRKKTKHSCTDGFRTESKSKKE